ncbi:MAG: hypothetical protein ACOYX1_02665 [Acidobacteriota bacterium]
MAPPALWHTESVQKRAVTIAVNGAEYLELHAAARQAGLTIPAYMRTRCGLEPWSARARERHGRAQPGSRTPTMALERLSVTVTFTEAEHAHLAALALAEGLSNPQYIRARCGFQVRWSSLPNTEEREREEDDAWERLQRLGLDPEEYFRQERG